MTNKLVIILGPTAVGKTDYSIETALKYDSPIISCDSRQIYKEMTIGTAVPSAEQLSAVQHYFIHSHTVQDLYTAGKYEVEALELINKLFAEGHEILVMAGGSGFYVDALVKAGKQFEMQMYVDDNHSIRKPHNNEHLHKRILRFLESNLGQ